MPVGKSSAKKNNIAADGETFRLLFEEHPALLAIYDFETLKVLRVNRATVEKYGYTRDEFQNMTLRDVLPEGETARLFEGLERRNPALQRLGEWKNRLKGGRVIDVEITAHTLKFEGRKAVLVTAQDVTERKRSEETLLKLKKAVDTSNEAIFLTDTDGVFTYVNPGFTALYGYAADEVIGRATPRVLKSGLLDAQVYAEFWKTLTSGSEARGEWLNKRKNGKLVDISGSATPILDDARRIVGYLGIQHDIGPRKQAENELRVAEENYRSIFEHATIGIYQSLPQGRFVSVNPAMARIFGYDSPEDMLDSVASIETQCYVNPADRLEFQRLMLENGEAHEFYSWSFRKDGSHVWIRENARAVKDAQGNIRYYEGFATDVTEQKSAEDGLRGAKELLEFMNRELEDALERERRLARTDGLTGLYNYRHFFELASREFNSAARYRQPLAILMFDADNFKPINDTYGHLAGDAMLSKMTEAVAAQMRASDVLARYGGDEFVALLPHTTAQQARAIAERIRLSVEDVKLTIGHEQISVTLSIGIAELCHDPQDDGVERVVQRADKALYAAKQTGRNRIVIFERE